MNVAVRTNDRFVNVDGLNLRYLEEGSGVPAIGLGAGRRAEDDHPRADSTRKIRQLTKSCSA